MNNYDVPLVVLFRSKFRSLFSGTSELGPQDVEDGVAVDGDISGKLEEFVLRICALIGNRRKNIEYLTPSLLSSLPYPMDVYEQARSARESVTRDCRLKFREIWVS